MPKSFLDWLISAPSPWDILAAVAAFGAWVINYLDRRDRRSEFEPIFEPRATIVDSGKVSVSMKIRNNFPHALRIQRVTLLSPKMGRIALHNAKENQEPETGFGKPEERTFKVAMELRPAGEDAPQLGRMTLGLGDTTWLKFFAIFQNVPDEITLAVEMREMIAGGRRKSVKMTVEVEPRS